MDRAASVLIRIGVVAVALAALPYKLFELDRFFIPKELILHSAALGVGALVLLRSRLKIDLVDSFIAVFIAWSAISAIFATNYWLAQRALGISVSSAVLFWGARCVSSAGLYRPITVACALATVVAAVTGLVQAYAFDSIYFSQNRAPGGTFGNRNFVAHFVTIGLPVLVYVTATARTSMGALAGSVGIGLVAALLVMTRTRAAWLAVLVTFALLSIPLFAARRYWRGTQTGGRLARAALAATVAVATVIVFPNRLNWRSDSPYLDSALGVVDYSSGSGQGRLAQYKNSMGIVFADPVFGAGPGNWPVRYVRFAPGGDKSLNDAGMTDNPWPSSDWVAFLSERGVVAVIALAGALALLFFSALRRWSELRETDYVLLKLALAGTIVATTVVSAFDAVLLLAAPAFLAWTVIGVASGAGRATLEETPPRWWRPLQLFNLLVIIVSVARSAAQTRAVYAVANGVTRAGWYDAAFWDPGSYRIALRAAELRASRGQCASAREHAQRASSMFPHAAAPKRILRQCR
jgi:hypothetical protein